jgi:hypothetical protein
MLKSDEIFVLNIKVPIHKGVLQKVINWHAITLVLLGVICTCRIQVAVPGQRHGVNDHLCITDESVLEFQTPL